MKKVYLLLSFAFTGLTAVAQQALVIPTEGFEVIREFDNINPSAASSSGGDTLGLDDFSTTGQILIDANGSGYLFGASSLDTSIVQGGQTIPITVINKEIGAGWIANEDYSVTGAMMWFGVKEAVSTTPGDLAVHLYAIGENAAFSASTAQPEGPGPVDQSLATVALPFGDVNVDAVNVVPTFSFFSSTVPVSSDFAITVDLTNLYGNDVDTVALITEAQGTSSASGEYSWYGQGVLGFAIPNTWIAASALGLQANVAIFAIVESTVGIEEQGFLNGVKMTTYPNPALLSDNVTIQYAVEKVVNKVELNIYSMNGQLVFTSAEGAKASGLYNLSIPTGTLNAGSYIYSIEAEGARMAKRMEILK
ncbi:MAG: T9SS type A sorting domain-containing protein [Flavobacteriales bacterium]|nr:T9SS type A sorting domain-containing protein [Flavobacteriales bacterium]